jgi:hypothetical protein
MVVAAQKKPVKPKLLTQTNGRNQRDQLELSRGFMSLERNVCLLMFDECHHAWKNHPYRLIMQEFYHTIEMAEARPKVLGMTDGITYFYQKSLTRDVAAGRLVELQKFGLPDLSYWRDMCFGSQTLRCCVANRLKE